MAILDIPTLTPALKEYYSRQVVENLVFKNHPALAMLTKDGDTGAEGKYIPIPIITGSPQGGSATFANAQSNQTALSIQEFMLTRKSDFQLAQIDNQTMLASKGDVGSFLKATEATIQGAFRSISISAAQGIYRSGTGSKGRISGSVTPGGVITLATARDAVGFQENETLQASSTDGGTPRSGSNSLGYVTGVDFTAGTITVSATALKGAGGAPTGWVDGDYLLRQGDSNNKMSGFAAWLPATAPTSTDSFYGVNRSTNPTLLAGVRYDGSAQSIEEALVDGSQLVAQIGGNSDYAFMAFSSYGALIKSLGSKVQYVDLKGPGGIGFRALEVFGATGTIKVLPDRDCPAGTCFLLQMDTWKLYSLGDVPQILTYMDSLQMLRVYNQDAMELRVGYYANLGCNAPGWNANITLSV